MKAILCGKIIPVTKDEIENGYILIEKGKIKKIGREDLYGDYLSDRH